MNSTRDLIHAINAVAGVDGPPSSAGLGANNACTGVDGPPRGTGDLVTWS